MKLKQKFKKKKKKQSQQPGMVVHTCDSSTQEEEAGELGIQGHSQMCS